MCPVVTRGLTSSSLSLEAAWPRLPPCKFHLLNSELGPRGRGKPHGATVIREALDGPRFPGDWLVCLQEESPAALFRSNGGRNSFPRVCDSEALSASSSPPERGFQPVPPRPSPPPSEEGGVSVSVRVACVCAHTRVARECPPQPQAPRRKLWVCLGQSVTADGVARASLSPAAPSHPPALRAQASPPEGAQVPGTFRPGSAFPTGNDRVSFSSPGHEDQHTAVSCFSNHMSPSSLWFQE